ncbi:MAG: TIGR03617 family F420-dependent LLM class oxidoreductase [Myxococcales bacterium]|nr:TIGR03617 family F420-dependent LLM class oxidoreductase [Myxococcales bacterium]MDH3842865.1 TIGR03617 family F420-dependent LLM class oxidoreductase [Myxococcales bacterium]
MRIDTFCGETNWKKLAAHAERAEAIGFDGFAIPEITGDPFIHAAMACNATERIQARTAIAVAFPRSPMVVASQSWAIQVNSGGRFAVGLGTQVKGHNERRFSTPWKAPRSRMVEYVKALRAIWRCWELGEPLDHRGDHYHFTLMTPEFTPPKSHLPMTPVYVAAVRPKMIESAASIADGLRLHGFCTKKYLQEVVMPAIDRGLEASGRSRSEIDICGGGFIMTGPDEEAVAKNREWVRYRVAFYGSTRTYEPVMALHGWNDLAAKLHQMSKTGQWKKMAAEVPDEVLDEFGVYTTYDGLPKAIEARFGGVSDTVELGFEEDTDTDFARDILEGVRNIKASFREPHAHYADAS